MTQQLAFALFNGLASGMVIFLVAAGVTLIFGILKIINFSHGAFFMLGAYLAFTLAGDAFTSVPQLLGVSLLAGAGVGLCGYAVDKLILSRIRDFDEHYVLIATFALLLVLNGVVKLIWGMDYHYVSPPESLSGALRVQSIVLPSYSVFVIVVGLIAFAALDLFLHRLWIGKVLRSIVADSWIVGLLGYNVAALYTFTVMLAFFLAGMAGALLLPNQSLSTTLADSYLLLGFVCCIIGGLGNVRGAFLAAILLGTVESVSAVMFNAVPGMTVYIAMVLALLFRPQGLFGGGPVMPAPGGGLIEMVARPFRRTRPASMPQASARPAAGRLTLHRKTPQVIMVTLGLTGLGLAVSLPLWANPGLLFIAGLTLIEILFALSWNFLFSYAGIVSFGHAAFFAIGAYGTGLMLKLQPDVPFLAVLGLMGTLGAVVALAVGLIALQRTTGIYLAILTMALAEILHLIIGSSDIVGRDDGLPAIPRPSIAGISLASGEAYYVFLLVAVGLFGGLIWLLSHNRFGRMLRAIHQDPERTAFMGTVVARYRQIAFAISGAVAAVSGSLFAPWTQIVTPETTHMLQSVSPVLNTLLGGAGSFFGPVIGTVAFAVVNFGTRTFAGVAEVIVGGILLVIVLLMPEGIAGFIRKLDAALGRKRAAAAPAPLNAKDVTP